MVFPTEEEAVEYVGPIWSEPETTFLVARARFYPDGL